MRLPGRKRHAGRAGHRRQELFVVDRELVVEPVARGRLGRRDQVADERHQARPRRQPQRSITIATRQTTAHGHQDHTIRRRRVQRRQPLGGRLSGSGARR